MVQGLHGGWQVAADTARAANTYEVKDLRREARKALTVLHP